MLILGAFYSLGKKVVMGIELLRIKIGNHGLLNWHPWFVWKFRVMNAAKYSRLYVQYIVFYLPLFLCIARFDMFLALRPHQRAVPQNKRNVAKCWNAFSVSPLPFALNVICLLNCSLKTKPPFVSKDGQELNPFCCSIVQ